MPTQCKATDIGSKDEGVARRDRGVVKRVAVVHVRDVENNLRTPGWRLAPARFGHAESSSFGAHQRDFTPPLTHEPPPPLAEALSPLRSAASTRCFLRAAQCFHISTSFPRAASLSLRNLLTVTNSRLRASQRSQGSGSLLRLRSLASQLTD